MQRAGLVVDSRSTPTCATILGKWEAQSEESENN